MPRSEFWPFIARSTLVSGLLLGLLFASRSRLLDVPVPIEILGLWFLAAPFFAGLLSKVVPGTKARGLLKSYLLAYVTSAFTVTPMFLVHGVPELPWTVGLGVDQFLLLTAGAMVARGLLLLLFDDGRR